MAEWVSGAFLGSFLNVLFDRMATPEFQRLFETRKIDMKLLQELQLSLRRVKRVLDDAESKQITDSDVKEWLDDLKHAAYEADDILDLIAYEAAATAKDEADLTTGNKIRDFCTSLNPLEKASQQDRSEEAFSLADVPKRMEGNVERIQLLEKQIERIGLREGAGKEVSMYKERSSVVDESIIFGRDADREAILKLLHEDDAECNSIGVIPIVGMGGIGKTTLAQLIYNDDRVAKLFACRVWVCVSDICDEVRIKRQILAGLDSSSAGTNGSFLQQIDVQLQQSLKDKKFLLVLDDLWNNAYDHWDKLLTPLKSGLHGSKILITTRNQKIASNMGTIGSSHDLRELDDDICWQIFEKHVFKGGKGDKRLESIGRQIASKCRGLPLAAKMLGGLLCGNQDKAEWREILESKTWQFDVEEVLPALRLSYQHLASDLKQCFGYCAIFPKDYKIEKKELIQLWMAEGFLVPPKNFRRGTEKWGEKCFQELVSRSFFQEHNHGYDGRSYFLMHDLINDLAQLVSGEFSMRMDGGDSSEFNQKNRYFSFSILDAGIFNTIDNIHKVKFLRTFFYLPEEWTRFNRLDGNADLAVNKLVSCLRCLRVLSLCAFSEMTKLPDSIEHLKHLRYLNLSTTGLKRLPETVCTLYNLQTLILDGCTELVELPENMGKLINLLCVDIRGATKLPKMPPGMGNLQHLVTLTNFILGKQSGSDLNELGKLQHLQGELSVSNLQNVVYIPNNVLKNKKELEDLELKWSGRSENSAHEFSVLEQLQPHTSIKRLSIDGYGGTKFADWVGRSYYTNLESLSIGRCENCSFIPPLGSLSNLKYLSISNCGAVTEVSMTESFQSLKTLEIENMEQWEDWRFCEKDDECGSLAKLEKLTIRNCPKLKVKTILSSGPTHMVFCSLHCLYIEKCPNFKIFHLVSISNFKQLAMKTRHPGFKKIKTKSPKVDYPGIGLFDYKGHDYFATYDYTGIDYSAIDDSSMPIVRLEELPSAKYSLGVVKQRIERIEEMGVALNALEEVAIRGNELCECVPLEVFPALKSLLICDCCNLKSLSASGEPPLTFLAHLKIYSCESLICFPEGGLSAPNMRHLQLVNCKNLMSLPEGMNVLLPSLECLIIDNCEKLESFPEGGLPANLQLLQIFCFFCNDKLIEACWQVGFQTLDALRSLGLSGYRCDYLNCFPFAPNLINLDISSFENLKFMNCKDLQRLTHLRIARCPNLESFLQQGLPSSTSIVITESVVETQSFQQGGLLPNLQSLEIKECDELICRRMQWDLQRFNTLSALSFSYYKKDDLSSFPEDSLLPSSLLSLKIDDFAKLEAINYKGLEHLTSLSTLEISSCEKLRCLPEGLPSSLSTLVISMCGLRLERRCQREKGQDWHKISHISNIVIGRLKV